MALSKKECKKLVPFITEWVPVDKLRSLLLDLQERPTGIKNKSFNKTIRRLSKALDRPKITKKKLLKAASKNT